MNFGILAAGEGRRLADEGLGVSKPMLPLGGVPMIGRLVGILERCGAESIGVVVNEYMADVREYLEDMKSRLGIPLEVKVKTTPSSMHTFYALSSLLPDQERFVATTVDTVFREEEFVNYVEAFRKAPTDIDGMMAVTDFMDDEKPLYVSADAEENIVAFDDAPSPGVRYVSGGIYGLDGKVWPVLRDCMERGVNRMRNFQRALLLEGLRLKAYPMGKIIDVDHLGDISKAEDFLSIQK